MLISFNHLALRRFVPIGHGTHPEFVLPGFRIGVTRNRSNGGTTWRTPRTIGALVHMDTLRVVTTAPAHRRCIVAFDPPPGPALRSNAYCVCTLRSLALIGAERRRGVRQDTNRRALGN